MKQYLLQCLFVGLASATYAQTTVTDTVPEKDPIELNEIVISANMQETKRMYSPTLVNVLNQKTFQSTHSVCLVDALGFMPGVRVEDNCQNCGFSQARINGLDGHYSQLLIDSRPVFSTVASLYGLEMLPMNMIERVEVIHGGGSALFGSSAVGGVINVITREPRSNRVEASHTMQSIGRSHTIDNSTALNASVVSDNGKAGFILFSDIRHRNGYDHNDDGFSDIPKLKNEVIGGNAFCQLSDNGKLSLQYYHIHDFHRGGDRLDQPEFSVASCEMAEHFINGGEVNYRLTSPSGVNRLNLYATLFQFHRNSYNGGNEGDLLENKTGQELLFGYSRTRDANYVGGATYSHLFSHLLFMPSTLTAGMEYQKELLSDHFLATDWIQKQHVKVFNVLMQNEWSDEHWSFLVGGRMDKNNLMDKCIFSPRVNLRYAPSQALTLRLNYADGFRAPQLYDEDLHVSQSGGELFRTKLADGLKEEHSHSLSVSLNLTHTFGAVNSEFAIEGFSTRLSDMFAERFLDNQNGDGYTVVEKYNSGGANVFGINLEGRANWNTLINVEAGYTLQQSRYITAEVWSEDAPSTHRFFRTPDNYGYLNLSIEPLKHWSGSITGTYTGRMWVQHRKSSGTEKDIAVHTPRFYDVNLKLSYAGSWDNSMHYEVSGGVKNLFDSYQHDFDSGSQRDSDYIYGPMLPRTFYLSLKVSVGKD